MVSPEPGSQVTRLLGEASRGNRDALLELAPLVYDELRALAGSMLKGRPSGQTLRTTALVNEAFIRLVDQTRVNFEGRSHFFGVAARAMRHILVDYARHRGASKRGGSHARLPLDEIVLALDERDVNLVSLDECLERLLALDERKGRVVELRFFAGMSLSDVARVLDVSDSTVERDWRLARAWLHREMTDATDESAGAPR
jgi:RNA polymerase sigma factor (TIGR02999 family)